MRSLFCNLSVVAALALVMLQISQNTQQVDAVNIAKLITEEKLQGVFKSIQRAPKRSLEAIFDFIKSIPFTKLLVAGGALVSLIFLFVRIVVVIGPILLLGALTRESVDSSDLLKLLAEFYNQIIEAIDEHVSQSQR